MESLQLCFTVGDIFINKLIQTLSRIVKPMQTRNCSHSGYVTFTLSSFVAFIPERTCQYDLASFDKKFEAQWGGCFLHCYAHSSTLAAATSVWVCPNQAGTPGPSHVSPSFQCRQLDLLSLQMR